MKIRYNPKQWYYWGRWNQVMLFTSPWLEFYKTEIFKKLNLDFFKGDMKILHGHYYFLKEDLEKLYELITKKINDKSWFEKFFAICEEKQKKMLSLENKNDLKRFIQEMTDYLGCSALVEFTDMCMERYLKELCKEKKISFSSVTSHIQVPRNTPLMEYKNKLRKLKKNQINEFVKEFKWVGTHAFEGSPLQKKRILEELKSLKKQKNKKKKNPLEFKDIIRIASELAYYRSNLIEVVDKVAFSYWKAIEDLGKKHNLTFFDIVSLTHEEKKIIPKDIKKRKKKFGIISVDNQREILLGKKLEKELQIHKTKEDYNLNEVKGITAYPGYVKGKAKILEEFKDVKKLKKGDILIAPETTPDYITAMGKAAAFITDIGGLTCHAAITSREMKKPCIIDTKIATKVFKDGDVIEVDANKGIIRKLK